MPKKFAVTIVQTIRRTIIIEADSPGAAREDVKNYGVDLYFVDGKENESLQEQSTRIASVKVAK